MRTALTLTLSHQWERELDLPSPASGRGLG